MSRRLVLAATASVAAFVILASVAYASCMPMTLAQQRARAAVIFDGVALEGPTPTGIQRFRVVRYRKGSGPKVVRVRTGYKKRPNGVTLTSVSIVAGRGQKWRIYGQQSARKVVTTTLCDGSRRL